jgi:hypothetical protein
LELRDRCLPRAVTEPEGLLVPRGLVPDVLGGHALRLVRVRVKVR